MMAKPKHGRLNTLHPAPFRPHHALRSPSPAVLSALAVIATVPPVVAGAPIPTQPPDFLCPFIQLDNVRATLQPRANVTSSSTATPTLSKCDVVADKYVQGTDSLWRKIDAWSLYGSTCCSSSTATPSAAPSQPSSSQIPVPTPTSFSNNFDTSVLPAGWNNVTTAKSNTESTIIFALAIVLAGSICVFVIGCAIWRRRKKRARDVEHKLRRPGARDDSQDYGRENDRQDRMRIWAKATARWKSNVQQSIRRRRKRHVRSMVNRQLSPTLSDSPQPSVVALSVQTRRGSIAPEEPGSSTLESILCIQGNAIEPPAVLRDPPRSASPPTYGASYLPRISHPPPNSAVPNPRSKHSHVEPYSVQRSDKPSFIDNEPLPYDLPSDGHVATDDKSLLSRLRQLASSPPTMADAASANTMQVSAPELREFEDSLEDLDVYLSEAPTSFHNGLPPFFPPPPSKADVPLPFSYLEDPLHYGEGDSALVPLPVPESSGPSLGAFPSAPPFDDPGLEPSAPSLEGEDEPLQDWEGASSYDPEVSTSVDLDFTPCAIESSVSSTVSSTTRASFLSTPESAARDGILPRYHP